MEHFDTDAVILGAGLTGLTIADLLIQNGRKVVILEKENYYGGLARTIEYNGFRFDLGGHRLYFRNDNYWQYVRSIIGDSSLIRHKRKSSIFLNNRFLNYPPNLLDSFLSYVPQFISSFRFNSILPDKRENSGSLKDWLYSNFGRAVHNIYFKDYSYKLWGLDTDQISADWALRRIGNFNIFKLVKGIFFNTNKIKESASLFYYPTSGIGTICEGLFNRISGKAQLILGAKVLNMDSRDDKVNLISYENNGNRCSLKFCHLISTIPLLSLCENIFPANNLKVNSARDGIRYRGIILVYVILNQKKVLNDYWVYFPAKDVIFSRISEPKAWSGHMAKDGKTSLCCEIFCNSHDEIWNLDDAELIARVISSLKKINFVSKESINDCFVSRIPFAYPLLYLNYRNALNPILNELSKFKNLHLAGRNGTHSYYDMEECVAEAMNLVPKICGR